LQHPLTHQPAAAAEALRALLDTTADALDDAGDRIGVAELVRQVLARGTGAAAQRQAFHRRSSLADVVRAAVRLTRG
jgi:carboxylate-amine ligase